MIAIAKVKIESKKRHSNINLFYIDLFGFLSISNKKIRPTVLSYAGLSTNPDEVRNFVK